MKKYKIKYRDPLHDVTEPEIVNADRMKYLEDGAVIFYRKGTFSNIPIYLLAEGIWFSVKEIAEESNG